MVERIRTVPQSLEPNVTLLTAQEGLAIRSGDILLSEKSSIGGPATRRARIIEEKEFISSEGVVLAAVIARQSVTELRAGIAAGGFGGPGSKERRAAVELIALKSPIPQTSGGAPSGTSIVILGQAGEKLKQQREQEIKQQPKPPEPKRLTEQQPGLFTPAPPLKTQLETAQKPKEPEFVFSVDPTAKARPPLLPGELELSFKAGKEQTKEALAILGGIEIPGIITLKDQEKQPGFILGRQISQFGAETIEAAGGVLTVVGTAAEIATVRAVPQFELSLRSPVTIETPFGKIEGVFLEREKLGKIAGLSAELLLGEGIFRAIRPIDIKIPKLADTSKIKGPQLPKLPFLSTEKKAEQTIKALQKEAKGGLEKVPAASFKPARPQEFKKPGIAEKAAEEFKGTIKEIEAATPSVPTKAKILTKIEQKAPRLRDIKEVIKVKAERIRDKKNQIVIKATPNLSNLSIIKLKLKSPKQLKDSIQAKLKKTEDQFKGALQEAGQQVPSLSQFPTKAKIITKIEQKAPRVRDVKDPFQKAGQDLAIRLEKDLAQLPKDFKAFVKTDIGAIIKGKKKGETLDNFLSRTGFSS